MFIGYSLAEVGNVQMLRGESEEAAALLRQAVAQLEPRLGTAHPLVLENHASLAKLITELSSPAQDRPPAP